jgi:hypothetical protein
VGSWYAGVRDFYFSLLILDEQHSPEGMHFVSKYDTNRDWISTELPYRADGLRNLKGISVFRWQEIADGFKGCANTAREDEKGYATKALNWLEGKGIKATV